ncbi:hypothetical protein TNCV_2721491 [Trichonephila clavipes]|nr:hypothetical protein TNCV_2721491 [Trichonephila clavipes]
MCFDFFPDLSNESVNFAFVWLISGVVPEFSESIFCSDKLSYVFRKAEVRCVNYPSGRGSRDRIRNYVGEILNGRIQIVYLGISRNVVIKNLLKLNPVCRFKSSKNRCENISVSQVSCKADVKNVVSVPGVEMSWSVRGDNIQCGPDGPIA